MGANLSPCYVYYRCTKGKGKDACSQRRYTREELLLDQLDSVLSQIEITPEIVGMLVRDSRALDAQETDTLDQQRSELTRKIAELDAKASKLLDSYLDGIVPVDAYRVKADEIAQSRRTLERRLGSLKCGTTDKTAQVETVAKAAMGARSQFATADTEGKRRLLNAVVLNAELTDCAIGSYQLKRPFEYLRRDPEGAFLHPWWALEDLNL